jgi:hypothetical protein
MGKTSFSGPVNSAAGFVGDVVGAIQLPTFTTATAPDAGDAGEGTIIFVTDGRVGLPTIAVSDGEDWYASNGLVIDDDT